MVDPGCDTVVRATVAACNGFVVLRATTLALVLPVRVGLDLATTVAALLPATVEDLRGVVAGDVVTAAVHVEGGGGGEGDVADVVVVEGTEQKKSCAKWKIKNKNKNSSNNNNMQTNHT